MAIHVNIGEAKTRLSELVAAAVKGQDVVLNRAGEPQVRLVTVSAGDQGEAERVAAKRAAFGMYRNLVKDPDIDVLDLKADDRWDEREERKFGDLR